MGRVLFCTFGSRGDLHPYIAIALELRKLGIESTIAANNDHADILVRAGIRHAVVPPSREDFAHMPDMMSRAMDRGSGGEFIYREMVMPFLSQTYETTLAAAAECSLIVGHPLAVTAPMIAEKLGLPYVYSAPQSIGFFSSIDPPVLPIMWWLRHLRTLGPLTHRLIFALGDRKIASWATPVHEFRAKIGLRRERRNPLLAGLWSDILNLGLFSPLLSPPAADWPPRTVAVGACLFDDPGSQSEPDHTLDAFLDQDSKDKPILFTLGSAAVETPGEFYCCAVEAAEGLGRRSLLLVGKGERPTSAESSRHLVAAYAPYSKVMPRCAAVVHQCGSGTTHEAMRAGIPQIGVPFSHDQPDNAFRVQRAGAGIVIDRRRLTAARLMNAITTVINPASGITAQAGRLGEKARAECGAARAAERISDVLAH